MKLILEIAAGKDVLSSLATAHARVTAAIKAGVRAAATAVQGAARRDFFRRGGGPPVPEILTSRHGGSGLVGTIMVEYVEAGYTAIIGPNKVYGAIHEFGGSPGMAPGPAAIPARPYMHPALDQETEHVQSIIANTLYEAIL